MKTPTLSDVASEANVAIKTASKVFNGDNTVRPYIKEHVLKIANKLNYRPNPIAQALRAKSLNIISVSLPELETPFFGSLFQEIYSQFNDKGFLVVPCRYIDAVNNANSSIYACATILCSSDKNDIFKLVQKGPVLTINGGKSVVDLASNVFYDFKTSYTEIISKLMSLGRDKIAIFCPHAANINYEIKFNHVEACLKKAGIKPETPETEKFFNDPTGIIEAYRNRNINAVFCSSDLEALLLMAELQHHGIRVPDDILLIGCDGSYVLDYLWTIICDTKKIAAMAVELIINELNNKEEHKQAVYEPELHTPIKFIKNR